MPAAVGPAPIPRDVIGNALGALVGLRVAWDTDARIVLGLAGGPKAYMLLAITGYVARGDDEVRSEYNATTDKLDLNVCGNRTITVSCRVASLGPLQPYDALERLRWGLRTVAGQAPLQASGLAFVRTHPPSVYAAPADRRTMLYGTMDVVLAWTVNAVPPNDPDDIVKSVSGTLVSAT